MIEQCPSKENFWQISDYFIYLYNVHGIIFVGLLTEVQSSCDTIRCKINKEDKKKKGLVLNYDFSLYDRKLSFGEKRANWMLPV